MPLLIAYFRYPFVFLFFHALEFFTITRYSLFKQPFRVGNLQNYRFTIYTFMSYDVCVVCGGVLSVVCCPLYPDTFNFTGLCTDYNFGLESHSVNVKRFIQFKYFHIIYICSDVLFLSPYSHFLSVLLLSSISIFLSPQYIIAFPYLQFAPCDIDSLIHFYQYRFTLIFSLSLTYCPDSFILNYSYSFFKNVWYILLQYII